MLRRIVDSLVRVLAKGRELYHLRGIPVVVENTRADIATADVLERLDEALSLIETYQPWRLAHLRRDLARIHVVRFPCRGAYIHGDRTCITELTFLARRDIGAETVASCIVHEGIHARVDRMGARRDETTAAREERLCRRAELDFGRALPPDLGAPVIERALATLAMADEEVAPAVDWAEALRRQAEIDDASRG